MVRVQSDQRRVAQAKAVEPVEDLRAVMMGVKELRLGEGEVERPRGEVALPVAKSAQLTAA